MPKLATNLSFRCLHLVVPCLDNIFTVLLISALGTIAIGATKPIFLDSGSPRGEEVVHAWAWFVIIV